MPRIEKVLVANRGEISLRIIRSLKEMGIQTVAVYSEADRKAPHVLMADQVVFLGPAPSSQSYLDQQKIIDACKQLKVDAIHPGYGFLSENAQFARAVEENNLIFIGPSAHSIEMMGSKLKAKEAVSAYNIPMVPGTSESVKAGSQALKLAEEIGFPLLIKASAGGGGKGMRIVQDANEFNSELNRAVSEATSAFGDGSVFLEKFIEAPRHIEVQIMGDMHGNMVHLFERECSVQRRHQKVVEETPSPALSDELRLAIANAAIDVARSANYYGAGTVEFMLDENQKFYFLEMNTRLQVEHPITEMITGIDLVKEQVNIAEGKKLSFDQDQIAARGHAIEIRVYAEDPENDFLPDSGILAQYQVPLGPGVRVDDGYYEGLEVPIYYDPMIAKLIVYAEDREKAIAKMIRAIEEYQITGVKTTLDFCKFVMKHSAFASGDYNTNFISKYYKGGEQQLPDEKTQSTAAAVAAFITEQFKPAAEKSNQLPAPSGWRNRNSDL
jgi:propionyl-CoA carboxylase alpha chain